MARTTNRSIDFYFNLGLIITFILFGVLLLSSCSILDSKDDEKEESSSGKCEIKATVRDFTGLDGCGKMLELEDGKKLIPFLECGTPPLPEAYAIYGKATDGTKVTISYSKVDIELGDVCMAGEYVFLNCIRPVSSDN
jgi:hypothetical protein